jgi:hypothetical protein
MRILLGIVTVFSASLSVAAPVHAEDPAGITRGIIEAQIQAFLTDDIDLAYSFAAPSIKAKFPDKAAFFAMVKKSYAPVYHPGNYAFGRTAADGKQVLHEVMITGRDGKNWKAYYKLSLQTDGQYKIDGVVILPDVVSKGI